MLPPLLFYYIRDIIEFKKPIISIHECSAINYAG